MLSLFALFATAFGLLAIQRLALAISSVPMEDRTMLYVLRLLAFGVIVFAIVDKNNR